MPPGPVSMECRTISTDEGDYSWLVPPAPLSPLHFPTPMPDSPPTFVQREIWVKDDAGVKIQPRIRRSVEEEDIYRSMFQERHLDEAADWQLTGRNLVSHSGFSVSCDYIAVEWAGYSYCWPLPTLLPGLVPTLACSQLATEILRWTTATAKEAATPTTGMAFARLHIYSLGFRASVEWGHSLISREGVMCLNSLQWMIYLHLHSFLHNSAVSQQDRVDNVDDQACADQEVRRVLCNSVQPLPQLQPQPQLQPSSGSGDTQA